jgi:hypothetical protein
MESQSKPSKSIQTIAFFLLFFGILLSILGVSTVTTILMVLGFSFSILFVILYKKLNFKWDWSVGDGA